MTTLTPHVIVDATCDVLTAASLPGSPTVHPWRLLPFQESEPQCVAVLANGASDAPASRTTGPAKWTRTTTLQIVAWLAPVATDESMGSSAATVQEAILDALFASEDWCQQWLGVPAVEAAIDPKGESDGRRVAVVITIRGDHSISRAYGTPDGTCQTVKYENEAVDGGDYHGETLA